MFKFFAGLILGVALMTLSLLHTGSDMLGATPSRDGFIGIYNATTTDLVLNDGFGSALAVDMYGRLITTSP